MDGRNWNFITQGDEYFSNTIICSATMIEDFYPNSTFYIYDGGLSDNTLDKIENFTNTVLIDWTDETNYNIRAKNKIPLFVQKKLKNNIYANHILSEIIDYNFSNYYEMKDFYMRQKPRTIQDCSDRIDEKLIWLDSDVTLIRPINEILTDDFDIAGTLRGKIETMLGEKNSQDYRLNAGVLFFNTNSKNIQAFVEHWLEQINSIPLTPNREQTAISDLFEESSTSIFDNYGNTGVLSIDEKNILMKTYSCYRYNYYNIDAGFDPNIQKILHFKAGKHKKPIFQRLINDIEKNNIAKWTRSSAHLE